MMNVGKGQCQCTCINVLAKCNTYTAAWPSAYCNISLSKRMRQPDHLTISTLTSYILIYLNVLITSLADDLCPWVDRVDYYENVQIPVKTDRQHQFTYPSTSCSSTTRKTWFVLFYIRRRWDKEKLLTGSVSKGDISGRVKINEKHWL